MKLAFVWILLAAALTPLLSQTNAPQERSFEVASVKPAAAETPTRATGFRGDTFAMSGATLRTLLRYAYRRANAAQIQIIGGPNWIDSDRFDVQAKLDCSAVAASQEQMRSMVQSLIEERFRLKAHLETREVPVYDLVIVKGGPKIKLAEDQTATTPRVAPPCAPLSTTGVNPRMRGVTFSAINPANRLLQYVGNSVPIASLIAVIEGDAGRPIIDHTQLKGLYDFKMEFAPQVQTNPAATDTTTASDPGASFFTAVQEQLGLKLEPATGPVEVLVMDSAQKPTEN